MRIRGFGNVGLGFSASKRKKRVRSRDDGCALNIKCPTRFSLPELRRATNDFSETHVISQDLNGKVYKAMLDNGQMVAIKRTEQRWKALFTTEVELLSRLRPNNLLDVIGFCVEEGESILVSDYIPNGSLKNILFGNTDIQLDWRSRVGIALQSARALAYLHNDANPRVIHRDIKPANILVDQNLTVKITNLGLAKILPREPNEGDSHIITEVAGTMVITLYSKQAILLLVLLFSNINFCSEDMYYRIYENVYSWCTVQGYLDPEYLSMGHLSVKTDVYSLGIVLLQLITRRPAYDPSAERLDRCVDDTLRSRGIRAVKEELMDPLLRDSLLVGFERFLSLALTCVKVRGSQRPSMREVVKEVESIFDMEMETEAERGGFSQSSSPGGPDNSYNVRDDISFIEDETNIQYHRDDISDTSIEVHRGSCDEEGR